MSSWTSFCTLPRHDRRESPDRYTHPYPQTRLRLDRGSSHIYRALQVGAAGYLLKEIQRDELLQAIRDVHRGKRCLSPAVASRLKQRPFGCELTDRELEVL